jgi:hypothetical protein
MQPEEIFVDGNKVKAEWLSLGEKVRFVVTNRTDLTAEEVYKWYVERGDSENRIKEMK